MSKQFYKYLSDRLIEFLRESSIKPGDRFYIQLDEKEQVNEFYNTLMEFKNAEPFVYQHNSGGEYKTFSINIGETSLVVTSTIDVTNSYLVTMRNVCQEQEGVWKNKTLLILCEDVIDSIKDGCYDLRLEGMPLSVKYISSNLNNEITKSKLSKVDREVVKFYNKQKLEDSYNTSLLDYKEILSIIGKNCIEDKDYSEIGLFKDSGLENLNSKAMQSRLKENNELYSKVEGYQEYNDRKAQLEKLFDDKGVSKLEKEDWKDTDFTDVKRSFEKNKENKPLEYIENSNKKTVEGLVYWERNKSDTAAGKRNKQIIVFNDGNHDEITLEFKFDEDLAKEFITDKSKTYMTVSRKKMTIKLPIKNNKPIFQKVTYKHKNQSKSKYDFNIAILNIEESVLNTIKTRYSIASGSGGKNRLVINVDDSNIIFGEGGKEIETVVDNKDDIVSINPDETIKISSESAAWDDDSLKFILKSDKGQVPIEIKEEGLRGKNITSVNILKRKRERKESFRWIKNIISQHTSEYYLEEKLKIPFNKEKEIIDKEIMYGIDTIDEINKIDISFSEELTNAYMNILNYYKSNNNIPSLHYLDEEIINLYKNYLEIYNKEIESINEKDILSSLDLKKNLLKLGTIENEYKVMFTPFAPLNIAYMLELYSQLDCENVDSHILERLIPNNLLPYIYNDNNELFTPIYQKDNIEWLIYEKKEQVSLGETNAFVAKVVEEKINQFISNFKYLFIKKCNSPIQINVINIVNDKEVVKGVFEYIRKQIVKDPYNIIPIEVSIYNGNGNTYFENFFQASSVEKIEEEFDVDFEIKNNDLDKTDVMRIAYENIKCYKQNDSNYKYAHISFYKSGFDDKNATDNTNSLESGLSIDGLLSTVTSNNNENDYRIGFGSKNRINVNNNLIRTASNLNEFAVNCHNGGVNPYIKETSIVTRPLALSEDTKEKLYNSSHWVTFIEPNFGLEYFKESNNHNLIIIHYSDQYTSTEQYDTITVTNKSEQYKYIIKEFLNRKNIDIPDEKINHVIKSFNSINGEWLLNLIANKSEYDREKLSIISALKYGMTLLNHEDIIWIPVSSEEILRVSNAVKLNKSEGIFTLKNLKEKGVHSDDLIFIGVNISDKDNLKLYYYPIEVKVGYNFSSVIDKGKIQINKTYELLKDQLSQHYDGDRKVFKNKFFRNFFSKLLITNAEKLCTNNIWPEKHLERIMKFKRLLLNDDYEVSFELESLIGKGALISFKKDNYYRSINKVNDVLFIELTEDDAYEGMTKSVEQLSREILSGNQDIKQSDLLTNYKLDDYSEMVYKKIAPTSEDVDDGDGLAAIVAEKYEDINTEYESISTQTRVKEDKYETSIVTTPVEIIDEVEVISSISKPEKKDVRILLGEAEGSSKKVYWEYNHKKLANRHMLITGKSGNGKTYFIQCALKELVESGVPAVIIDYTDGFKTSQLEPEFKEYLGDNLKQFIVAKDKFPLNPFKKGRKELDEDFYIDEDYVDVAERFKSVIGSVYKDLGIQQLNSVYQAVIRGLEKNNGSLDLRSFRQELAEDKSSYAQTTLSQLSLLIDKNPFEENKDFGWGDLDKGDGKLFIIQLTGFTKDVQRIITEMILWDLWNYKLNNGNKDNPFTVVLDECQNLNFGDNSPCKKILLEGRKFGWSAWFSTQFLKGQMDKATISGLQNAAQKVYFAQTEEEAPVVASVFAESNDDKKEWTKRLIGLEKGTCITYGSMMCDEDKLYPAVPIKIRISSLEERIER